MRRLGWSLIALAAVANGGCSNGGSDSPFVKIDDMEGTSGTVEWPVPAGLEPGGWFASTDCSELDRLSPPPNEPGQTNWSYAMLPEPQQTFPGVMSTHAAHMQTLTPITDIWGAVMGFSLAVPPSADAAAPPAPAADAGAPADGGTCPAADLSNFPVAAVDVSAYKGITFWAKAGAGTRVVRVELSDINTDPRGGHCDNSVADQRCFNFFYVPLLLTDTMTRYTVDFSQLQQEPTWGYQPVPDLPDLRHVFLFQFEVDVPRCATSQNATCANDATSLSFDIWIDDIYFVTK